jgi:hypothetical protein
MSITAPASRRSTIALSIPPVWVVIAASGLAWCLLLSALPPARQDFPLNDDWAFARGAFRFARGEGIDYDGWASMPQLGQWLWACPFVWLFGESHVVLRISTVLLSWAGLAAFYDLLRQADVAPGRSALATATLAFCPLFFLLQGTFMTDVPALSLALVSLALYARALRSHRPGLLVVACALAVLAAVTRQNTLAVAATAAVLLGRRPELRLRAGWWVGVLLPVAAGLVAHLWFSGRGDVRPIKPTAMAPAVLLSLPFVSLHLCGLAALPLVVFGWRGGSWKVTIGAFAVLAACAGYWLLWGVALPYGGVFPYTENILTPWGALAGSRFTGPFVGGDRPVLLGNFTRSVLTLIGCAAAAMLLARAARQWRHGDWAEPLVLFTLFAVPFLLITRDLYDRYLLFLLPGALALAARHSAQDAGAPRAGLVTVGVLGLVSVGLMHDWLSWNAARWDLGRRAVGRHVEPRDIEGGVEWDGWYSGAGKDPPSPAGPRWPVLPFTGQWFPAVRGRYWLSFSELRGARRVDSEPYNLWLPPGRQEFYLLEVPPLPDPASGSQRSPAPRPPVPTGARGEN